MKTIVAIIIYNRFENLKRWIRCWKETIHDEAELFIIHNYPDETARKKFEGYCINQRVHYIPRVNIGFDIGAFQDVCRGRLPGFPTDWEYLLWVTDDTLPMAKDFISPFIGTLQDERVGIACMQISLSVNPHVRTTGFCLKRSIAARLVFPADPVRTKQDCYHFEHRGGARTMTNQVRAMGLDCRQVAKANVSPLWDQGYWKRLDRLAEYEALFPTGHQRTDKVTFICPIYNSYPQIISSLILQTYQNWELLLIHDGPNETGLQKLVNGDPRIKYIETEKRVGNWGHQLRRWALEEIAEGRLSDPDYIVITNADNYHAPVYTEYLLRAFRKSHTAVAAYCDTMIHNYIAWNVMQVRFERGYIDCAGVMVKRDIACEVGWRDITSHSSDWTYFSDIATKYSPKNFIPVKGCLLVHN